MRSAAASSSTRWGRRGHRDDPLYRIRRLLTTARKNLTDRAAPAWRRVYRIRILLAARRNSSLATTSQSVRVSYPSSDPKSP